MPKFIFSKKSKKIFLKLPKEVQNRITSRLILLKDDDDIFAIVKKLKDTKSDYYRLKIGRYRLILNHTDTDTFKIADVAHRKDIYKQ